jgi:hypothetical protein
MAVDDNRLGTGVNMNSCYNVINAGKTKSYHITRNNAKHFRYEWIDGRAELIGYCGPGNTSSTYPNMRTKIDLTEADAVKYSHMGLIAASGIQLIKQTSEDASKSDDSKDTADQGKKEDEQDGDEITSNVLTIPNDWRDATKKNKLAWASQIMGSKVTDVKAAEEIVEAYIDGDRA